MRFLLSGFVALATGVLGFVAGCGGDSFSGDNAAGSGGALAGSGGSPAGAGGSVAPGGASGGAGKGGAGSGGGAGAAGESGGHAGGGQAGAAANGGQAGDGASGGQAGSVSGGQAGKGGQAGDGVGGGQAGNGAQAGGGNGGQAGDGASGGQAGSVSGGQAGDSGNGGQAGDTASGGQGGVAGGGQAGDTSMGGSPAGSGGAAGGQGGATTGCVEPSPPSVCPQNCNDGCVATLPGCSFPSGTTVTDPGDLGNGQHSDASYLPPNALDGQICTDWKASFHKSATNHYARISFKVPLVGGSVGGAALQGAYVELRGAPGATVQLEFDAYSCTGIGSPTFGTADAMTYTGAPQSIPIMLTAPGTFDCFYLNVNSSDGLVDVIEITLDPLSGGTTQ